MGRGGEVVRVDRAEVGGAFWAEIVLCLGVGERVKCCGVGTPRAGGCLVLVRVLAVWGLLGERVGGLLLESDMGVAGWGEWGDGWGCYAV